MANSTIPEEIITSDVAAEETQAPSLVDKSLAELSDLFQEIRTSADAMLRSKEAESVKSAFYKLLTKLKGESPEGLDNPFEAVEENFNLIVYESWGEEEAEMIMDAFRKLDAALAKKGLKMSDGIFNVRNYASGMATTEKER